ncbi:MAG TPA: amidohydrolase family protein [Stellaceae bacterium]|nr:amidohydrolase family protein [Stellaceae bacterium]
MTNTLFSNVQIFDGTSATLQLGEVLVQGNRIQAVETGRGKLPREGAVVVDGSGATLMPGLCSTHNHLSYNNGRSTAELTAMPVEEHVLLCSYNAKLLLDCGFTALIGAASAKPRLDIVIRNEINAGRLQGPRMRACTPEYTVTGGLADERKLGRDIPGISIICDGPDEFRRSVRTMIREGVDIVKFDNSGDSFCYPQVAADINPMTEDEVRAICETTLNLGKRLAAHAHADSGVRQCIKYGVEFIFHASFASDATIEQLEKVKHKHWVAPAIAARYNTTYEAGDFGISTEVAEKIGNKRELEAGVATMTKMHKAGIRVMPFGDYGFAWIPHGTDTRDFEHFVNLFGFEPWEVLRAATAYGGEAFGGDMLGQIRPGYLADILLLDGDPLRDLTLFQDRRNILAIMKDGQFHKTFQGRAAPQQVAAE